MSNQITDWSNFVGLFQLRNPVPIRPVIPGATSPAMSPPSSPPVSSPSVQSPEADISEAGRSSSPGRYIRGYFYPGFEPFPPPASLERGHTDSSDDINSTTDSNSLRGSPPDHTGSGHPVTRGLRSVSPITPAHVRLDCVSDEVWEDLVELASADCMDMHVELQPQHYDNFLATMKGKFEEVCSFLETNPATLHLDWVVGNPTDPSLATGDHTLMADDTAQKYNVDLIKQANQKIGQPDEFFINPKNTWNRVLPYGNWIDGAKKGFTDTYMEIQVKRISGKDIRLLHTFGVHPDFAFLGLLSHQSSAMDIDPSLTPPSPTSTAEGASSLKHHIHPHFAIGWLTPGQRERNQTRQEHLISLVDSDPTFRQQVAESFIYLVRVVAIPHPGSGHVNGLTGPHLTDRKATLCGMGGWVVPPLSSRLSRLARQGNPTWRNPYYTGLPAKQTQTVLPVEGDWTVQSPVALQGDIVPVWEEVCEPTLEDVYSVVWALLARKRFIGLRIGVGFGREGEGRDFYVGVARGDPFRSPSQESLYHSANLGSGGGE